MNYPRITTPLAQCLSGHQSKAGSIHGGQKVDCHHAAVKAAPIYWVDDGLTVEELHAAAVLRFGMALPFAKPWGN